MQEPLSRLHGHGFSSMRFSCTANLSAGHPPRGMSAPVARPAQRVNNQASGQQYEKGSALLLFVYVAAKCSFTVVRRVSRCLPRSLVSACFVRVCLFSGGRFTGWVFPESVGTLTVMAAWGFSTAQMTPAMFSLLIHVVRREALGSVLCRTVAISSYSSRLYYQRSTQ